VGCGTGATLEYIKEFSAYYGYDTDWRALDIFDKRYDLNHVHLYSRRLTKEDVVKHDPDLVAIMGLLHHLNDDEVLELLHILSTGLSIRRVITVDTVYITGRRINNFLAMLDRGRYVRNVDEYRHLVAGSPF
jgi:SAM-dependent methyltransferase